MTATSAARPRVDVLAYPRATTTRFLLVVTSLLTAGLFVGIWVHNGTAVGDDWVRTTAACSSRAFGTAPRNPDDPDEQAARQHAFVTCTAAVERRRAAFALGGLAVAAAGGAGILYLAPAMVRRRRRLAEPGPKLAGACERFDELAVEAGVAPPLLVVGHATQRDAFSFGTPGRYTVALPRGVAVKWRDPGAFDPLVRHELAHVAAGDVPVASISTSLWYALAPLLLVPVALGVVTGDLSSLAEYAWRAPIVAVVALLVSRATLRARELDADVRAVAGQPGGVALLTALLRRARRPRSRQGWRQVLANHPDPEARIAAVDRPEATVAVTFVDGLTAAFLAALSAPLLIALLTSVLAPLDWTSAATVLTFALLGPLLGATIGLALWRQAVVARVTDGRPRVLPVACGVAVGLAVGRMTSLGNLGLGWDPGAPAWIAISASLGVGMTYGVAGLSELSADAVPRLRRPRPGWITATALSSAVFGLALWISESLREAFDGAGWLLASGVLFDLAGSPVPVSLAVVLAAAVWWLVRAGRGGSAAPGWLTEDDVTVPWPPRPARLLSTTLLTALVAGAAAAGLVGIYRGMNGGAHTPETLYGYLSLAVAAAGGAAAACCALIPSRGAGLAFLAGPVASVVAALAVLVVGVGGGVSAALLDTVVRRPVGTGWVLVVLACVVAAVVPLRRSWRPALLVPVAGGVLAALLGAAALVSPTTLAPFARQSAGVTGNGALAQTENEIEIVSYLSGVVPEVKRGFAGALDETARLVNANPSDARQLAGQIEAGPVADLATLADGMRARTFHDGQLADAHRDLVAFLDLKGQVLETYVAYLRTGDQAQVDEGKRLQAEADRHTAAWLAALQSLTARVSGGH